jgi:restriction system protein
MDWKQYQEEVATFFRSLGFKVEVNHVVEGVRSKHAIDVFVTFDRWGYSIRGL